MTSSRVPAVVVVVVAVALSSGFVVAHNGVDHSASPPAPSANSTYVNPLEAVFSTPNLSYLQYAILICGLEGSFVSPNTSYTILAPSNSAFQQSSADFLTSQRLGGILAFHIIPNALLASDLANGLTVPTLWGLSLNVTISGGNISFSGASNKATVTHPNIKAGKNVIHIVDNVLDRRSNPATNSPQAQATLSRINYSTMLTLPAPTPGQMSHNDINMTPSNSPTFAAG